VALTERATAARGVCLSDELAQQYATEKLLTLEETVAIMQGLAPLLPGTLHDPQYLDEHEREVGRLLRDAKQGVLPMPCRPTELDEWARSINVELPEAFRIHLPRPDRPQPSPPPAKLAPDQQDRIDCQRIAIGIWKDKPSLSIEKMLSEQGVAAYTKGYALDTVRKWLSQVDSRPPEKKPGPRRRRR
jgi:hypothetical protein